MSVYKPKEHWLEIEIENIEVLLNNLDPLESKEIEPWLFTPQNLEKVIGTSNLKFTRKSWQNITKKRMISLNVLMILFKHLFFKWTEKEYTKKTNNLTIKLINNYGDWWEKPILRKWFKKKENMIEEFGNEFAGQIIASIFIKEYSNKPVFYVSSAELPEDSEYIRYYEIIDKMRKNIPGYDELELWRGNKLNKFLNINRYYIIGWGLLLLAYIILSFLENSFIFNLMVFVAIIYAFFFCIILILNSFYILRDIPNIWIKVFIFTIDLIFCNYIFILIFESLFFYIILSICWIITIISYTIFKIKTKLLDKNFGYRSFIFFYTISFWNLIWSIIFLFTLVSEDIITEILLLVFDGISDYNFIAFIVFTFILYGFFLFSQYNEDSVFSPRVWMRLKLIKPLEIYKEMGIINDFALILANLNNQTVEETIEQLEISKSIDFNCRKFGINFKININSAFQLISKHKEEIFYNIIPNCPKDKTCSILENKLEQFNTDISENIIIRNVDITAIGLKTYEKLPDHVKISLERAEIYFNIFKIYNMDSYGISVLELTKSLEYLLKMLMHIFISTKDVLNWIPSFEDDSRMKGELSIVLMIKKGVKDFPLGFLLKTIREICSLPDDWKIKQEFGDFLKKKLPIRLSLLNKLLKVKVIRDIYAHSPGESITPEQYFNIRELCYQVINLLEVNLSNINSKSMIKSKLEQTKVA